MRLWSDGDAARRVPWCPDGPRFEHCPRTQPGKAAADADASFLSPPGQAAPVFQGADGVAQTPGRPAEPGIPESQRTQIEYLGAAQKHLVPRNAEFDQARLDVRAVQETIGTLLQGMVGQTRLQANLGGAIGTASGPGRQDPRLVSSFGRLHGGVFHGDLLRHGSQVCAAFQQARQSALQQRVLGRLAVLPADQVDAGVEDSSRPHGIARVAGKLAVVDQSA